MNSEVSVGAVDLRAGSFGPLAWRGLWRSLNAAREVDSGAMRAACIALFIFYVAASLLRPAHGDLAVISLRAAVLAYIAGGALIASRTTWSGLRVFTVGLSLIMSAATAGLAVVRGNQAGDLGLLALALFGPQIFLQTGIDVLLTVGVLAAGTAAVIAAFPPAGMPPSIAAIVLGGALFAGAVTALVLIAFRARLGDSTAWWQEACARERTLREFCEHAASHLGETVLANELAARFRNAVGVSHCAIVLGDAQHDARVVATAGAAPGAAPDARRLAEVLAGLAGQPQLIGAAAGAGVWAAPGAAWLALPIAVDQALAGAVVLSAATPRTFADEELLLWRAMARQVGTALGSARLFARLQEALRARGEFVDTMSHELRSPLHVILGYAEMLAEHRVDPGFATGRIRASGLELLLLIENTMTAARLGSGKMSVQATEFDVAALLDEVRETATSLPEADAAVALRWEIAADLPPVRLDRLKVKEIVHNLVSNALKFTARGMVTVRAVVDAGALRLDVEDTGSGIPADVHARIFEMFERVELPGAARPAGVGLGLFIVRRLVGLMHGSVSVDSSPGCGARFTVRLPIRFEAG